MAVWADVRRPSEVVMGDLPIIVIEVVLVFGGVLAFAWWQFRDLARERRKRESQRPSGDRDAA